MYTTKRSLLGCILIGAGSLVLTGCARHTVALDPAPGESLARPQLVPVAAKVQPEAVQKKAEDKKDQPAAGAPERGERFQFPAGKAGQVVAQLLRPTAKLPLPLEDLPPGPVPLPPPASVGHPPLPVPLSPARPIILPAPLCPSTQPRMLAESPPFSTYRDNPHPPSLPELSTGAAVALPPRDVSQPVALSLLGLPLLDRVPLEDPTADASLTAALAAVPPARTDPVAFAPQTLPDPFQNAQTVKLQSPPPEAKDPIAVTPRLPPAPPQSPAKP